MDTQSPQSDDVSAKIALALAFLYKGPTLTASPDSSRSRVQVVILLYTASQMSRTV